MKDPKIKNSDPRIDRALSQKLFLIETIPTDLPHLKKFVVMGTTGNVYTVSIDERSKCSCPDFLKTEKGCKHIFFILLKVMQQPTHDRISFSKAELDSMFLNIPAITSSLILNESLRKIYKEKMIGMSSNQNLVDRKPSDDICPICLDPLEASTLDFCKFGCGKQIHSVCFKMWAKKNQAICVFCRKKWEMASDPAEYVNLTGKKRGRPKKNAYEAATFREKIKKRKMEEEEEEEEEYEVEEEGLDEEEEEEEEDYFEEKDGGQKEREEGNEEKEDEEEEDEVEEEEERLIYEEMKRVGSSFFPWGGGEKTEEKEGMVRMEEEEKEKIKRHKKKKHKHHKHKHKKDKDKEKKNKNRKEKEDGKDKDKEGGLEKKENEKDAKNDEGHEERRKDKKEKKHKKHKKDKKEKREKKEREKNKDKNVRNEKKLKKKDEKTDKESHKNNGKTEKPKKKPAKKEKLTEKLDEDEISEEHYGNNFQTKAEDLDFDAIVKGNRRVLRSHTRIFPVLKNNIPTESEKNDKNCKKREQVEKSENDEKIVEYDN